MTKSPRACCHANSQWSAMVNLWLVRTIRNRGSLRKRSITAAVSGLEKLSETITSTSLRSVRRQAGNVVARRSGLSQVGMTIEKRRFDSYLKRGNGNVVAVKMAYL